MRRTYFLSYFFKINNGDFGQGMTEVTMTNGINNFSEIILIAEDIKAKTKAESVIIINWREIDAPESAQRSGEAPADPAPNPSPSLHRASPGEA